jgi:uncharacterized protein
VNKNEIENKIKDFLSDKAEILSAYIFGSFVKSDNYHDIDVAVYLKKDFNKDDSEKYPYGYQSSLIGELNLLVRKNIDLVIMNNAEILIQQRIINKGVLLFTKDDRSRIIYENYIRKLYIDAEPLRRIKRYYLNKNIINA